ncbi:MAG: hypothetical protein RLZZ01_1900 [Actinomycetota bacterium]
MLAGERHCGAYDDPMSDARTEESLPVPTHDGRAAMGVIRTIYLYVVCLVTLVTSLFASVGLVSAIVDISYPDPYVGYYNPPVYETEGAPAAVDPEAEAAWREKEAEVWEKSNPRQAVRSLLRSVITLGFAVPLFALHWRTAQRDRRHDV